MPDLLMQLKLQAVTDQGDLAVSRLQHIHPVFFEELQRLFFRGVLVRGADH